jgi:hypothetical protein
VTNWATLQFVVAVATGVLVKIMGVGVIVNGMGSGVKLAVATPPPMGVALSIAATVSAAAVLAVSSGLLEGRLQALINKAMITSILKRRILIFMIVFSFFEKEFYRR